MRNRLRIGFRIAGLLSALTAAASMTTGCGDAPTSPATPRNPDQTYVLSGVVTERRANEAVPTQGAVVRHLRSGRWATTDSTGSYTMTGVPAGSGTVTASKDGYTVVTAFVEVTADTHLDLEIRRLPSTVATLSGTIYEETAAGRVPVEGVRVEESYREIVSMTDASGRYSLTMNVPEFDGFAKIDVTKEGFQASQKNLVVVEDMSLDIGIVRR